MDTVVLMTGVGGVEKLEVSQTPSKQPGLGMARVRNLAIGVNFIDIYHRTGLYPLSLPSILGVEAAGVIEALGEGVTGFAVGVCEFFMPEANIAERSNEDRVPYELWAKQGHITLIPGSTIDPSFVAQHVMNAAQTYSLQTVAYDRWRIEDFKRELGLFGGSVPLEPFGQGFKDMSPAVDTLERCVAEKLLRHGGNPVLNMCASNAVVTRDPAGSRKLDKSKATGRIDGLVALAMALQISGRHEPEAMPACLAELLED